MRSVSRAGFAIALALGGATLSAMLTTDYKTLRHNGASYFAALGEGFHALGRIVGSTITSSWFMGSAAVLIAVLITRQLSLPQAKPKSDPIIELGLRMAQYARAAQHDQRYRQFSMIYKDTIRICREMDAFFLEVRNHGLPTPSPQSNVAEDWIDLCGEYLMAVGPYLRQGNVPYAEGMAQQFAERYPLRS